MKNYSLLLVAITSFKFACGMEMEEDEITTIVDTSYPHQNLAQHMTHFVSYLQQRKAPPITLKELTSGDDELWQELKVLRTAIKKRDLDAIRKNLKEYNDATKKQHQLFSQGITLLKNDQTEMFKFVIKNNLREKKIETFFEKKICNHLGSHDMSWLKIRIYALNILRKKLTTKNTSEKIADMADEIVPCTLGSVCGIGLITLLSPFWPWGISAIGLSSCICLGCHQQFYTNCRPSTLYYLKRNEEIDEVLNREIESLLLKEDSPRKKTLQSKKGKEKEALLRN